MPRRPIAFCSDLPSFVAFQDKYTKGSSPTIPFFFEQLNSAVCLIRRESDRDYHLVCVCTASVSQRIGSRSAGIGERVLANRFFFFFNASFLLFFSGGTTIDLEGSSK